MNNTISQWICSVVVFTLTGFTMTGAWAAADAEKEAKHEMRKMQAQLSAAQKEKTDLAAQLENIKKQLGEMGAKSSALEKKSGGQKKQFAELTTKLQESEANLQKMTQQFTDTSTSLQQVQKEKELLQKEKEQENKRLSGDIRVCEKKNTDLYRISTELLEKYQSKGIFTALLQAEPFTQLEKVKMQNLMQEYKDKTEAAKIATSKVSVSPKVNETVASGNSTQPTSKVPLAVAQNVNNSGPDPVSQSNDMLGTNAAGSATANLPDKTAASNVKHALPQ